MELKLGLSFTCYFTSQSTGLHLCGFRDFFTSLLFAEYDAVGADDGVATTTICCLPNHLITDPIVSEGVSHSLLHLTRAPILRLQRRRRISDGKFCVMQPESALKIVNSKNRQIFDHVLRLLGPVLP